MTNFHWVKININITFIITTASFFKNRESFRTETPELQMLLYFWLTCPKLLVVVW